MSEKDQFKSTIEEEISKIYNEGIKKDRVKGHKRIVSMRQPDLVSQTLLQQKRKEASPSNHFENVGSKNRHDKCKMENTTQLTKTDRKPISELEFESIINRLYQ